MLLPELMRAHVARVWSIGGEAPKRGCAAGAAATRAQTATRGAARASEGERAGTLGCARARVQAGGRECATTWVWMSGRSRAVDRGCARARARHCAGVARVPKHTATCVRSKCAPAGASRRAGWRSTMPVDMPRGSADHSPGSSDDGGARERERDARHSGLTDAAPSCRQSWGDFQVRPISPRASASHVWLHSLSLRVSLAPADHAIPRARARA